MIIVKSGTIGVRDENGNVEQKTSKDKPFSLSAKAEKRLVSRGVAKYVKDTPADTGKKDTSDNTGKITETLNQSQITRLNKDTHESIAKRLGVDLRETTNRETRGKAIWEALEAKHAAVVEVDKETYEVVEEAETIDDEDVEDIEDEEDIEDTEDIEDDEDDSDDQEDEDDEDVEDAEDPPTPGADEPVT